MFSSGADVNLNAVYRSTSAGTTKLVIGETYRQAGTNAVFKFVEINDGTPTVVQGMPLVSGMVTNNSLNGGAGVWNGEATALGLFQGIAQNTDAVTATDVGSGRTVCVWSQISGNNVSHVSADEVGEVGFDQNVSGNAARLTATGADGQDVGTVNFVAPKEILYVYDSTVDTSGSAFTSLSAGDAFTPYAGSAAAGAAGVISALYKDSAGLVRGFRFTSGETTADVGDNLIESGGIAASNVLLLVAPGYASLRGTY